MSQARSKRQERGQLVAHLRADGQTYEEIAADLARRQRVGPLLAFRWAHNLTQEQAADRYNQVPGVDRPVTFQTISDWESWPGSGRAPSVAALNRLARMYHTTTAALLDGEDYRYLDDAFRSRGVHDAEPDTGAMELAQPRVMSANVAPDMQQGSDFPVNALTAVEVPTNGVAPEDDTMIVVIRGRNMVERRQILQAALTLPGVAVFGPVAGILDAEHRATLAEALDNPTKVGPEVIEPLGNLVDGCRKLDDVIGGQHLIEPVAGIVRMMEQILPGATEDARPALLNLAGNAAQFSGWLALDTGDHSKARHYFGRGLEWAAAAGDQNLTAYLWAWQSDEARIAGDPGRAVTASDAARNQARSSSPMIRAWVERTSARAHAIAGNRVMVDRRLEATAKHMDGQTHDGEPGYIYHFTREVLPAERGTAYAELGHGKDALALFTHALKQLPGSYVRDRAHFLAHQANAYRLIGEPRMAAETAISAVVLARQTGSNRVLDKVRRLYGNFSQSDRKTSEGRILADLLSGPARATV